MNRSSTFKLLTALFVVFAFAGMTQAQGLPTLPVVNGTVTFDGEPVPDFTMMIMPTDTSVGFPFLPVMTDEEGFFQHNLVPGSFTIAPFDSFLYQPMMSKIDVEMGDTATVDFELVLREQDETVTGSVTFEGKGQPEVMVYFFKISDDVDLDDFTQYETHFDPLVHPQKWASYKTMTDDQGNFSLGMLNGKYIMHIPGTDMLLPAWMAFEVPATLTLDVILKEKKHIAGSVENFDNYMNISIAAFSMNSGRPAMTAPDSLGNYSMAVAPGTYIVRLTATFEQDDEAYMYTEYYNEDPDVTAHVPKDASQIDVQDDVDGIDFVLPVPEVQSFTINGMVTSEKMPVDSAMVSFGSYNAAANLYKSYVAYTDENGMYSIIGKTILEEDSLIGFVAKEGYFAEFYQDEATYLTADPIVYQPGDELTIDFEITKIDPTAGFSIFGNVVDDEGEAVTFGQITAYTTDTNIGQATTQIDSNGFYEFDSIFVDGSTVFLQAWAGPEYLPSIYDGKDSWEDADAIVISGDNAQADFTLQKKEPRRFWLGELVGWIDPGLGKVASTDAYEGDMVYIKRTDSDTWQEVDYVDENGRFTLPFETSSEQAVTYDLKWTSKEYGDQQKQIVVEPNSQEANATFSVTSLDRDFTPVIESNQLFDAYPNPFNPTTKIKVNLVSNQKVSLVVYDVTGQKVKTLYNGFLPAGSKTLTWNGTNENGSTVSSGLYFYQLKAAGTVKTKSVIFLK